MQTTQHQPDHHYYMSQALELAARGRFSVSPNPMVGCVIVKNGQIIGQGYHRFAGGPHAEIYALEEASSEAKGATAYVTLEPCAHHGRTPPCVDALIAAGISKVVIACRDPNPLVNGRGVALLQNAGISVHENIGEERARKLNEKFFHYITHKTPFVIAKWAMSLDGKTVTQSEDDRQISGEETAHFTQQLRREVDAIIIGANTARIDNPLLTVRDKGEFSHKQPIRIILSNDGDLPAHLNLFSKTLPGKTFIATTNTNAAINHHAETIVVQANQAGNIDLHHLLKTLAEKEITSVLVEGGMRVHESFMQDNLINKLYVYIAPYLIGQLDKKHAVNIQSVTQMQNDHIVEVDYV